MIGTGIFTIKLGEKTVGFKFGMYASAITEKESGYGIFEVFKRIFEEPSESSLLVLNYMYGGAVAYAKSKGEKEPTVDEVGDWMEEIGIDEAMKIYSDSITSYKSKLLKNNPAPENETTKGQAA